ncbi:MAG: 50S ribosomal protein L28 [Planctomycetes bacterium]|nr:50S ribosomal protein L28 [Planctomycetota bacterium]
MARRCPITGRGTTSGQQIARRGLPKKKGGIGLKTTGHTRRKFKVNVQHKRIWVQELGRFVRVRVSTRGLKLIDKRGAYVVLREAGLLPKGVNKEPKN